MSLAPMTETDGSPQPVTPAPAPGRGGWAPLRPLILRLHFYAGVLVAPFLLVAATTGFLYAASFQAEKIIYSHEMTVPVGDTKLPISEQVAAARKAHPEGTVAAVRPSPEDDASTRVMLSGVDGIGGTHTLAVFVDPYTAQVRGALEQYGSTGALPLRTWIDEFHANLKLGDDGRLYSELAASWLWVITGGGLVLWFGRRRTQRKVRGTSGRRRTLGLHGSVGVWAALGLIFLSATGLTWSTYAGANIGELRTELRQETPAVSAAAGGEHSGHGSGPAESGAEHGVGLDKVLAAARAQGLGDPVEIVPPADDASGYVVSQVQRSWPTKQDSVAVDPATGEVTDTVRFADFPVLAKLTRWGIDAHTGVLFGLANQLVLMALALGLILLILWGYRMWWQRGRASAFGRPIPRGAWQQVPAHVLVPLMAGTAVLGYFVPLLGLSLAAFVAVDVLLGEIAYRRGRRTYGPAKPGGSARPGVPAGADETAGSAASAGFAESGKLAESAGPAGSAKPTGPVEPAASAEPARPGGSAGPAGPAAPAAPAGPAAPAAPAAPGEPAAAAEAAEAGVLAGPAKPAGSAEAAVSGKPGGSAGPVAAGEPAGSGQAGGAGGSGGEAVK